MSSAGCLVNVNPNSSCHPKVWDGLLFPIDTFWVFVCTTSNSGHAAEGKKEEEKSSPSFLGRAEAIPVEKANIILLFDSSIAQCFGQISLVIFSFVEKWMQHQSLCLLNRMSGEQDSGVKAVRYEARILMAKQDIGYASVTNSGECRGTAGIYWRHLVVQQRKCLICSKAGKDHCLNVEQLLARVCYRAGSIVGG